MDGHEPRSVIAYLLGAAGFLGSHLSDALIRDGWTIVGVDNLLTGSVDNVRDAVASGRFTFVRADVSAAWNEWIDALDPELRTPDLILHLASPASPVDYGLHPLETMSVNALGVMHAVETARRTGARVVFASTSECYGDPLEHPQRESYWGNVNPVGIRACYDEAKRFGEAYLTSAVRAQGIDGRIVRIFNTYGPRMQIEDGRVVPNFCMSALRGRPLTIYGDGSQTRSFCYVDDLIAGIVQLAVRPDLSGRVVNIGNPEEHTILEFAAIVARCAGRPLETVSKQLPPDDPGRRRPDITLARELLGWEPVMSLDAGLARTFDYFRSVSSAV